MRYRLLLTSLTLERTPMMLPPLGKSTVGSLLVVVASLAAGCGQQETTTAPATTRQMIAVAPGHTTEASAAPGKPDVALSADDLVKEMEKDLAAAEKKYRDKVLGVTGVVEGFRWLGPRDSRQLGPKEKAADPPVRSILMLAAGDHVVGLQCITVDAEPWASVSRGQRVKVLGKWHEPGSSEFPALANCVIIDKGAFTTPTFTAAALVRAYAADRDGFATKYDNQDLIVSGEIESRAVLAFGPTMIKLKTDEPVDCICLTYRSNWAITDVLAAPLPGKQVKFLGRCSQRNLKDTSITIDSCLGITKPLPSSPE